MEAQPQNYQTWLSNRLTDMKKKNASLSLRSVASILKISPASLSQVISGKRPMSKRTALRLADYFSLSPDETKELLYSTMKTHEPQAFKKRKPRIRKDELKRLEEDEFKLVSDWYHYAILSLSAINTNSSDPKWIADRLGITEKEAQEGFDRLERMKLIERNSTGFIQISQPLTTTQDVPSSAIRKHHKQNLQLAEKSLDRDSVDERAFGGVTMAIDKKDLNEAKKMLRNFRRRFWKKMESNSPTSVYTLALQFFPVMKETR